ncbi:hypothetical protein CEXT_254801 [Caerostris extrusa]|uniref:Uncharacterized protein n=1 Tax=Caerostris extrusa TaxID=172846 RepID=A0AAV4QUD4_CAEEX|nr:hypothetical protein CEXT_254801 [Caerostris extrusa]
MVFYGQEAGLEDPTFLLNENIPSCYRKITKSAQWFFKKSPLQTCMPDQLSWLTSTNKLLDRKKLSFLPMNRQTMSYPIELNGNLFKTSGRAFRKGGRVSIYILCSKEQSGGSLKRISKLEN